MFLYVYFGGLRYSVGSLDIISMVKHSTWDPEIMSRGISGSDIVSLKWGKIGSELILMTNRKSHMHFRLVPKSTT